MKLLLVYTPFCAPSVPPYSITYLKDFLTANAEIDVACLDLNAKFHKLKFKEFYNRLPDLKGMSIEEYGAFLEEFEFASRPVYSGNNKAIVSGKNGEFFQEMLDLVMKEKPDLVGFSLVYSSQAFYALSLIKELKKQGIECVVGGPAVNSIISKQAVALKDEFELLDFLKKKGVKTKNVEIRNNIVLDFSVFPATDYLSKERILPFKTSRGCFYKQCAFCTHHNEEKYSELDLVSLQKSIALNYARYVFFIDDMISKKRLLELADLLIGKNVSWWCQLRPTKDLIGVLPILSKSGLRSVAWGVESGSQVVLDKMRKGIKVNIVEQVLQECHDAKICTNVFVLFGFPGERKEDFLDTIEFLKKNSKNIDLVSISIFGLQKGSFVFNNPEKFGITRIFEEERTILDDKITYLISEGLSSDDAKVLRKKYDLALKKMNKLPRSFNYLKEQTLLF